MHLCCRPLRHSVQITSRLRRAGTVEATRGGQEARGRPRVHKNGFLLSSHPCRKFLELWIVHAMGYLQRRPPLQGDISRTSTSSYRRYGQLDHAAAATSSYAIRNLSM